MIQKSFVKNSLDKKLNRLQIFDVRIKTKKKFYINTLKSFFKKIKKENNFNFFIKKKIQKIVVNKSPHVNVKAKKKYVDFEYFIFIKNVNTKFYNILKKLVTTDTKYIFYKKII